MSDAGGPAAARRIEASHRRILVIAVPMMISHVTTPLLGFVDATVIGRLGEAHLLGAVAIGAVLFDFLFWAFSALRMGTAGLTAQAWGAGEDRTLDAILARALVLALGCGILLVALQKPIAAIAWPILGPSGAVLPPAQAYFDIRIWSAPFAFVNYAVLGFVIGRGRTDLGLMLQVGINVANIVLSVALVTGAGLGVAGTAIGTVAAEMAGAAAGIAVVARLGARPWRVPWSAVLDRPALVRMMKLNGDIAIRTIALLTAFTFFAAQGARGGDVTLAANAVLMNLFLITGYVLDGFATAAEQLCGQALGSRDERGFRRSVRLCLAWCTVLGVLAAGLALAGGGLFIDVVSTHEGVRQAARDFLVFAALTPLLGALPFTFDGVFIGATWSRAMRDLMLLALAAYFAAWWALTPWGNTGLWIALLVFLASRGLGQALAYPALARRTFAASGAGGEGGGAPAHDR